MSARILRLPPMGEIITHSFKDLHVKGFDYLCLGRKPDLTLKLYLFDGVPSSAPEVVNPHDHRYPFLTRCLAGSVTNHSFARGARPSCETFHVNEFEYRTPLNGGDGFTFAREAILSRTRSARYAQGQAYALDASDLHTIQIHGTETALLLHQYADLPGLEYTSTFMAGREPPSLSGLYNRFTPDEVMDRLRKLSRISGLEIEMEGERR